MADDKAQAPNTVIVKLRDQGSVFHDPTQQQTIGGKEVKKMLENPRIARALKGGALVKASQAELDEWNAEEAQRKAEAAKNAGTKVTVETPPGAQDVKVEKTTAQSQEDEDDDKDEHGEKRVPQQGRGRK